MFGNSYTALVIQINNREVGGQIWENIKGFDFVTEIERLYVRYFDLAVIVLQGTSDFVASIKETIYSMLNTSFDLLMKSHSICVETCSNLAKNTLSRGRVEEEEVESIECLRMSLVFHGYADILPFLSLLNVPKQLTVPPRVPRGSPPVGMVHSGGSMSSMSSMSPRHMNPNSPTLPRPVHPNPPRPMNGPRNPMNGPRPSLAPRQMNEPRLSNQGEIQLRPRHPSDFRPRMTPNSRPPYQQPPPNNLPPRHPRSMYVPRGLPPRPSFGNPPR